MKINRLNLNKCEYHELQMIVDRGLIVKSFCGKFQEDNPSGINMAEPPRYYLKRRAAELMHLILVRKAF